MISPPDLSPEQQAAVESDARAILVVASAGSGKTEVVARRVEHLLSESPQAHFRVLALSYTTKAANELKDRFRQRLGAAHKRVDADTIHGFSNSLLSQQGTRIGLPIDPEVIVRDEDRAELLASWLAENGQAAPSDLGNALHQIDLSRARREPPSDLQKEWDAALSHAGAVDYESMLTRAEELLRLPFSRYQMTRLYHHVIVDEAQNLTPSQYSLLTAIIGSPTSNSGDYIQTMMVGDDKQSLVGFAGADSQLMRKFECDYQAMRFDLTNNFRSAKSIVSLGERVSKALNQSSRIASTGKYEPKEYKAEGWIQVEQTANEEEEGNLVGRWVLSLLHEGLPSEALAPGESDYVRAEQIAVLARSSAALQATEDALRCAGHEPALSSAAEDWLASRIGQIVYEIACFGSAPHHRSTQWQLARLLGIKEHELESLPQLVPIIRQHKDQDIQQLADLVEIEEPADYIANLSRITLRSEGEADLAAWHADSDLLMRTWSSFESETQVSARTWSNFRLFVSRQQRGDDLAPGIRLQTIHKAQGREYRAVAVVGVNEGQLPDFRAKTNDKRAAELRAFYVAVTRASRLLLLTRAQSRMTRFGPRSTEPSSFLRFVRDGT